MSGRAISGHKRWGIVPLALTVVAAFAANAPASTRNGTSHGDRLTGTPGPDVLRGGRGNDRLDGRAGADRLLGGAGNDTIIAGDGDTVDGGSGNDRITVTLTALKIRVNCGSGRDSVTMHAPRTVTLKTLRARLKGCERVKLVPTKPVNAPAPRAPARPAPAPAPVVAQPSVLPVTATPAIVSPVDGSWSRSPVVLKGTAVPGSAITVLEGADVRATTTATLTGDWQVTLSPSDGTHVYTATAGNSAASLPLRLNIDTQAPSIALSGPSGLTANAAAVFTFPSEDGVGYQCALDRPNAAGAYAACTSPVAYAALGDGEYAFRVRATDRAGNTTDVARAFTVDTTAPDASIDGPSGPTRDASPSFTFATTEADSRFECRLDGPGGTGGYAACTSPKAFTNLPDGAYSFHVRALDAAGNTGSDAVRELTVDTVAPGASIDGGPSDPTSESAPTFSFKADEPDSSFQCRLDGLDSDYTACTSPKSYINLPDGTYVFHVRAVDAAGNTGTDAVRTMTVDRTPPDTLIETGPTDPTADPSPSFSFSSSEAGSSFECRFDTPDATGTYAPCTSPVAFTNLPDGPYTFRVRSIDAAGNTGGPAARYFVLDTAPLAASIDDGPTGTATTTWASFSFSATKAGVTFRCRLDGVSSWCSSPKAYPKLANGTHTFVVQATDSLGNRSSVTRTWTVDSQNPPPAAGCMPDPSACGFPDVENTGVTPGTELTPVDGVVTLDTPGQVYENKQVTGSIIIAAPNVTIRNVKLVSMDPDYAIRSFSWEHDVSGLNLDHVEIDLNGHYDIKGIAFDGYTARHVFFHNGSDCAHMGDHAVVEDSLCVVGPDANGDGVPDNSDFCTGNESHFDGFQSDGGNYLVIRHNTIRNPCDQTSAILMSTNTEAIRNVTIQDNLLGGGGYSLYCNAGGQVINEAAAGNRFSRAYFDKGGFWAPIFGCDTADVFAANVWDETDEPLQ